ncbi:MAG TPA: type II secretion system protein M [Candidatus Binatia bacterium]|nr:type II secretion system protein M [Candidatus Binatia bacterium]
MNALLARMRAWWTALAEREQRIVGAGAVAGALLLAWAGLWEPLRHWHGKRVEALDHARAVATRLEAAAADPRARGAPAASLGGLSLMAAVDQSARAASLGKAPTRIQPDGDQLVKIWLDDVSFDGLVRWLRDLQLRYGVRVDTLEVERRSGAGLVSARLTLVRG